MAPACNLQALSVFPMSSTLLLIPGPPYEGAVSFGKAPAMLAWFLNSQWRSEPLSYSTPAQSGRNGGSLPGVAGKLRASSACAEPQPPGKAKQPWAHPGLGSHRGSGHEPTELKGHADLAGAAPGSGHLYAWSSPSVGEHCKHSRYIRSVLRQCTNSPILSGNLAQPNGDRSPISGRHVSCRCLAQLLRLARAGSLSKL